MSYAFDKDSEPTPTVAGLLQGDFQYKPVAIPKPPVIQWVSETEQKVESPEILYVGFYGMLLKTNYVLDKFFLNKVSDILLCIANLLKRLNIMQFFILLQMVLQFALI